MYRIVRERAIAIKLALSVSCSARNAACRVAVEDLSWSVQTFPATVHRNARAQWRAMDAAYRMALNTLAATGPGAQREMLQR
jgi:hypothetical protein